MQKLPTTKANFIFKNMQDFNQTTRVWPQDRSVFADNISFYFYPIIFIKNLMKQLHNGTSWLFQHGLKIFRVSGLDVHFRMQNTCFSTHCATVSKWQKMVTYETFWIKVQGLFVSFACKGSSDPVRVLRLFHNEYTGYNWSIYWWDFVQLVSTRSNVLLYLSLVSVRLSACCRNHWVNDCHTVLYGALNGCSCRC